MEVDGVNVPIPEEDDDELFAFGDDLPPSYEIQFRDGPVENCSNARFEEVCSVWETYGVTHTKKEKMELRWEDLNEEDKIKFRAAKQKEVKAWLDHQTVKRVAQGTLRPEEVMRCRRILCWKPPEQPGGERRAKARLVVLAYTQ